MGELKNRGRLNAIVDNKIREKVKELSKKTKIPVSRLADEAWEDLLIKYKKKDRR